MPIDACTSTFAELAASVLPSFMVTMRAALERPHALGEFCTPGIGVKSILRYLGRSRDFSGCYVLLRELKPFYVGISRGVIARLRQHSTGSTEFNATLAYRMANEKVPHEKTRREAMQDSAFRAAFNEAQALLRGCKVAFIEIANPLELYLFEAYCAMALDTCEWNTFRTH
jgi:predicted GIY-YIG superfamily endonuclease